jgi:ParG
MSKKVDFRPKPTASVTPDQWVESRTAESGAGGRFKRLTIDIPMNLHIRIKTQCASRGTKMADEIRAMLEERFPER